MTFTVQLYFSDRGTAQGAPATERVREVIDSEAHPNSHAGREAGKRLRQRLKRQFAVLQGALAIERVHADKERSSPEIHAGREAGERLRQRLGRQVRRREAELGAAAAEAARHVAG